MARYPPQGDTNNYIVGTDANKISSPNVGMTYYAYDTLKEYICFFAGTWTLIKSPDSIKYSNHLGTVDNMMSTTTSGNGTATTASSTHRMDLSSGVGVAGKSYYASNISVDLSSQTCIAKFKVQNIVNGTSGTSETCIGIFEATSPDNEGSGFVQFIDGTWNVYDYNLLVDSATGATYTQISSVSDGDDLTVINCKIGTVYLVNGTVVATQSHSNTSTNTYFMGYVQEVNGISAVARTISIDYIEFEVLE
jgi:hypothetical protein